MINSVIILTLIFIGFSFLVIGLVSLLVARIVAACYYKKQIKQKRHLRIVK